MNKTRFWTKEEDEFLQKHFCSLSLGELSRQLNGRSKEAVNKRIIRLKLRTDKTRKRMPWRAEEDLFLRKHVNEMTIAEMAAQLGRPVSSIASRLQVLALTNKPVLRRWTAEEDDYLIRKFGQKPLSFIAKKLKRTMGAVEGRLNRLGMYGGKSHNGDLTTYNLAAELNVSIRTVYTWIENHGLPCYQAVIKTRAFTMIDIQAFWRWARAHKNRINWSRVSKHALVPEPAWVQQQRRYDVVHRPQKQNLNWTAEEDAKLWHLYYSKRYTQKQIGVMMGRSAKGIQKRLDRLRKAKKAS